MDEREQEQQHEKRQLSSLTKSISPPPRIRPRIASLPALEAGQETTHNHPQIISAHLRKYAPDPPHNTPHHSCPGPIIPFDTWTAVYTTNAHCTGHHFVIHQHDHPIAGPHYDLRLQISASSSVSWAIMYGLPGDPNSRRLNRNATETRVHCLWNHLIETASAKTGSMIIWDTGYPAIRPHHLPRVTVEGIQRQNVINFAKRFRITKSTSASTAPDCLRTTPFSCAATRPISDPRPHRVPCRARRSGSGDRQRWKLPNRVHRTRIQI
ncbi:DNA polymerase ligase-domain-containing protein [Aspergillus granulosus]|uniref:DNA polymerase ligase-domain-containing protein n=1 Tax=Aspergillus granulosus TaxID=176169 RepID=A0ABR4GTM9_9EURO